MPCTLLAYKKKWRNYLSMEGYSPFNFLKRYPWHYTILRVPRLSKVYMSIREIIAAANLRHIRHSKVSLSARSIPLKHKILFLFKSI